MKPKLYAILAAAGLLSGLAAILLVDWDPERTRREAFVHRCNEEGAGGTFTSREYCEALYERTRTPAATPGRSAEPPQG